MKILVNLGSIMIMMLSLSSLTSAHGQQRPSQRSFATVLSKIKEKKSGRDKMIKEAKDAQEKIENVPIGEEPKNTTPTATIPTPSSPKPEQLMSRREMEVPKRPRVN